MLDYINIKSKKKLNENMQEHIETNIFQFERKISKKKLQRKISKNGIQGLSRICDTVCKYITNFRNSSTRSNKIIPPKTQITRKN